MAPQAEEKKLDFTLDCSGVRHGGICGDGEKLGGTVSVHSEAGKGGVFTAARDFRIQPGDYDVVLTDIQMPVMNGWDAARAIRQFPDPAMVKIPIAALSANVFESDLRRSVESGINAHRAKPMDVLEVQKTIDD